MSRQDQSFDSIIEALWYGELIPIEDPAFCTPEMKGLLGKMSEQIRAVEETFTEEQQRMMEQHEECRCEYESLLHHAVFKTAFKLGARLAIEMLTDDKCPPAGSKSTPSTAVSI